MLSNVLCSETDAGFYPVTRKEFQEDIKTMDFNEYFYVSNDGKVVFYADPYAVGTIRIGIYSGFCNNKIKSIRKQLSRTDKKHQ